MLCVEWMMVRILRYNVLIEWFLLEYSEALAQMPRWKKILFTFLCISTCCCFGGCFCCLCGFGCCCNFCCNHCCGKYKRDEDVFSTFQVRNSIIKKKNFKNILSRYRKMKMLPVWILKQMSMEHHQQLLSLVHKKLIQYLVQPMKIQRFRCLHPMTRHQ
jgi:hypothetical protein